MAGKSHSAAKDIMCTMNTRAAFSSDWFALIARSSYNVPKEANGAQLIIELKQHVWSTDNTTARPSVT